MNTYLNSTYYNGLNSTAQSQIVEGTYYAGAVTNENNDIQDQISDEKVTTSKVKVALPTVSEYLRANTNTEQCGTLSLNNDNFSTCKTTDWMSKSVAYLTISPRAGWSTTVFRVISFGSLSDGSAHYNINDVFPVLYLSSDITLSGIGTSGDPFVIS